MIIMSIKNESLIRLTEAITKPTSYSSVKEDFFKYLEIRADDYSDIELSNPELTKIRRRMSRLTTGASAAIPIVCPGPAGCPFAQKCPFVLLDKERRQEDPVNFKSVVPKGRECLVEIELLQNWTRVYAEEYGAEETSFTDLAMISELAEIELMLWRLNNNLAKPENADLTQWSVVGIDKEGNSISKREVNTLFEIKERLSNRKSRVIKLLVGDRQEKYKRDAALKLKDAGDASTNAALLKGKITQLLQEAEKIITPLKEAEGSVVEATVEETISPEDLINDPDLQGGE